MNLANHRAPGLVLHIFLVCFSHSAIASLAPGLFDSAHEAATGLNDAHEATAARSALDTLAGHTNPHTNPSTICRRFLGGCLGGLRPAAGARTSTTISHASPSIGESTDTERLTFLEKLIKSFTSKLRGFHDQFVLRSRAVRDNWHLGQSSYEESVAKAIRGVPEWTDNNPLVDRIAELALLRKLTTAQFGAFSPELTKHILNNELPKAYKNFHDVLDFNLGFFVKGVGDRSIDPQREHKLFILSKLLDAEMQDPALKPMLQHLQIKLDKLKASDPLTQTTTTGLENLALPSRPSFLAPKLPNQPRTFLKWQEFQFKAEKSHFQYLNRIQAREAQRWSDLIQTNADFLRETSNRGVWTADRINPEKLTIEDFAKLKDIGQKRLEIISRSRYAAYAGTPARSSEGVIGIGRPGAVTSLEVQHRLAVQALVIQSISEPYSKDALEVIQNLANRRAPGLRYALKVSEEFQKQQFLPPSTLDDITRLRPNIADGSRADPPVRSTPPNETPPRGTDQVNVSPTPTPPPASPLRSPQRGLNLESDSPGRPLQEEDYRLVFDIDFSVIQPTSSAEQARKDQAAHFLNRRIQGTH